MRFATAAVIVTVAGLALTAGASTTGKAPASGATSSKTSMRTQKPAAKPESKPAADGHEESTEEHADNTGGESKQEDHSSANAATDVHEDTGVTVESKTTKPAAPAPAATESIDAAAALNMLKEGNERWVADTEQNPSSEPQRRQQLAANGQHPFVTVLTCADSRLPVERIFDRGVGEIFTVRVAGNIAGDSEIGTIEYGTEHLKTPLLVIMGHTKCGAVAAAVTNAEVHGKVAELVNHIEPAVDRAKRLVGDSNPEILTAAAVKENVWQTVTDLLKSSSVCRELVKKGELQIVGAVCDISTGKVEFMGEHPWQSELVAAFEAMSNTATAEVETH